MINDRLQIAQIIDNAPRFAYGIRLIAAIDQITQIITMVIQCFAGNSDHQFIPVICRKSQLIYTGEMWR